MSTRIRRFLPQIQHAVATCMALAVANAHALDLTVRAGYEATHSDNVTEASTNEQSGWIQTPQIFVAALHESVSVSGAADYSLAHAMYPNDSYGDQTTATGNARLEWRAIPDLLAFDVSNASTQTTISSQGPNVPSNEQITNTADAGANLALLGPANHLINLRYDYAVVTAQRTETDNNRQTASAAYIIPLSERRRVQLNASFVDVKYDNSTNSDYTSPSGNLQFVSEGDSIDVDTNIGYTVLDQKQGADDVSGTIGALHGTWHASANTNVNASYVRSIQTESDNLTEGNPDFGQTFSDNTGVTTPYTLDTTTVGISTVLGHNRIGLTGYIENQDYDGASPTQPANLTAEDQDTKGLILNVSRALRPSLDGELYAEFSTADFKGSDITQDDFSTGLRIDWTHWRHLSIAFVTEYTKRTSDDPTQEYTEWRGTVGLFYTLIGKQTR